MIIPHLCTNQVLYFDPTDIIMLLLLRTNIFALQANTQILSLPNYSQIANLSDSSPRSPLLLQPDLVLNPIIPQTQYAAEIMLIACFIQLLK